MGRTLPTYYATGYTCGSLTDLSTCYGKLKGSSGINLFRGPCQSCLPGHYRATDQFCGCSKCERPDDPKYGTNNFDRWYYTKVACSETTASVIGSCYMDCEDGKGCTGTGANTVCTACPSGKYRRLQDPVTPFVCGTCKTCTIRQRRVTDCGPVYDRTCEDCPAGNIVTGANLDTCSLCGAGKYADQPNNVCRTCKDCPQTSRMTSQCAATGDRQCTACTGNEGALSLNAETCLGCIPGYIRTLSSTGTGSCVVCNGQNGGCLQGQYVNCYTSAGGAGMRDCVACAGHASTGPTACSAGYGVTRKCVGTEIAQAPCALCPAGTERPSGTPMVDGIQKCVACGVGKFKAGASSAECGPCTNKPGNSEYVAWGLTEAGSNACPW